MNSIDGNWAEEEARGEELDYSSDFYASTGLPGARRMGLTEDAVHDYDPTTGQWS